MASDTETPKPQAGTWTLIAPDGRNWTADSPLKCVGIEQRERVPADVALERIAAGIDANACDFCRSEQMRLERENAELSAQCVELVDLRAELLDLKKVLKASIDAGADMLNQRYKAVAARDELKARLARCVGDINKLCDSNDELRKQLEAANKDAERYRADRRVFAEEFPNLGSEAYDKSADVNITNFVQIDAARGEKKS